MGNEALDDNLSAILVKYATSWRKAEDMQTAQKAIQELLIEARIEERLKIYQMKESIRPSWFLHDKELQKRIKQLNKEPV